MSKESLILNPNEITPIANGKPKTKNRNVSISTEAQLIGDNETVVIDIATNLHDESKDNGNIIKINISGTHFETFERTLERFPQSLLGNREKRNELHRNENGEIFIDRNSRIFERVLTFYQTGLLEEPPNINRSIFIRDVRYYGLDEEASECGMAGFRLASYKDFPQRKWQAFLWNLLEYPQSSKGAKIISALSIIIIFLSIIVFCWETIPEIRHGKHKEIKEGLNVVEKFCIAYFTLEFILRLVASPNKVRFMCSILNIIDLLAILPFYVTTAFQIEGGVSIYFLRTVRLVRVFRIFKLSRYSGEMKILGKALNDSARELAVLVFFIMLGVLVFSSAGFYAEEDDDRSVFSSIPHAFWWSIVTMTTVGYGDEVPKSIPGRLVGAVCAMCGILVIAMPIPIIVNNFTKHYSRLRPVSKYWSKIEEEDAIARTTSIVSELMPLTPVGSKFKEFNEVEREENTETPRPMCCTRARAHRPTESMESEETNT